MGDVTGGVKIDKREMKKHIQYDALFELARYENEYQLFRKVAYILDKDVIDLTKAEVRRFEKLLQSMIDNAEKKI